ncbi:autorepressor SdpR family transcription factor [Phenylobacterium sp.]|uniref:autorepressor SdpR family transcription factor n=1 Tax=Phenylobacterium sp. TaxID=1871053 RepID=UPI00121CB47D|nr:autorepressor SdpR family transcription factor [Phenylobacterium sp.]THD62964.1 MAG: ArsR family transcriptional regulator [Phenylobacterium sp.]
MNAVFKALSDPTRRHVLELLRDRPMTAGELADHFPVSKPTMSTHFAVLREANLVDAQKLGKTVIYRLKLSVLEDALLGFVGAFSAVAQAAKPADDAASVANSAPKSAGRPTS